MNPDKPTFYSRISQRIKTEMKVKISVHESMSDQIKLTKKVIEGTVVDINKGGIGVLSPLLLPKGCLVRVKIDSKIFYPDREDGFKKPVEAICEIRSCCMSASGIYRLGIAFKEIQKEDEIAINKFLEKIKNKKTS